MLNTVHLDPGQRSLFLAPISSANTMEKRPLLAGNLPLGCMHIFTVVFPTGCSTTQYPYPPPPHGRFEFCTSLSPRKFQFTVSYFASKILTSKTPPLSLLGTFYDLPWGAYGFFMELHVICHILACMHIIYMFCLSKKVQHH